MPKDSGIAPNGPQTVKTILHYGFDELRASSPSPELDARLLLSKLTDLSMVQLISQSEQVLEPQVVLEFLDLLGRRKAHEPVAYLIGEKEFFGLAFAVNTSVLIPRPETEILVERAIKIAQALKGPVKIVDLGTGSGCIAVTVAVELKKLNRDFSIWAVDSSAEALETAGLNASRHGVKDKIEFSQSDWFSALSAHTSSFDLILANPPYIAHDDSRVSPETKFEPQTALYANNSGLADIFHLIESSAQFLSEHGVFLAEIGFEQPEAIGAYVNSLAQVHASFKKCQLNFLTDLAGLPRVLELKLAKN